MDNRCPEDLNCVATAAVGTVDAAVVVVVVDDSLRESSSTEIRAGVVR